MQREAIVRVNNLIFAFRGKQIWRDAATDQLS